MASPPSDWLDKGDNAWQLTAATLVALQSIPGLVILYGGFAKKKWSVNSSLMALYAFAATLVCWVGWGYNMAFGDRLLAFLGRPAPALDSEFLLARAFQGGFPAATMVWFQFVFAGIAPALVAGAVMERMRFAAWAAFVPLWHTIAYTVGAYSVWNPAGWLARMGVVDFAGGFVVHLASGVAGFTAAYWVGPRSDIDTKCFPPNNITMMLAGAGMLWMGWTGFNGGAPYTASALASLAVLNTHVCAATSLLTWLALDAAVVGKPSAAGAVNGVISGLVCITPAAGLVECWTAMLMGVAAGSIPWYTLTRVGPTLRVDDTFAVVHTHAVAGALGALLTGVFAAPRLCSLFYGVGPNDRYVGLAYALQTGRNAAGLRQVGVQLLGVGFFVCLNVAATTAICLGIRVFVGLRMSEEELRMGDEGVHGEVVVWYGEDESRFVNTKVNYVYEGDDQLVSKIPTYEMHRV